MLGGEIKPAVTSAPLVGGRYVYDVALTSDYDVKQISGCGGYYDGHQFIISQVPASCRIVAEFARIGLQYQGSLPEELRTATSLAINNSTIPKQIRLTDSGYTINWLFEPNTELPEEMPILEVAFQQQGQPDKVTSLLPALRAVAADQGYAAKLNPQQQPLLQISPLSIGFSAYAMLISAKNQLTQTDFNQLLHGAPSQLLLPRAAMVQLLISGQAELPESQTHIAALLADQSAYLNLAAEYQQSRFLNQQNLYENNPLYSAYQAAFAAVASSNAKLNQVTASAINGEYFAYMANFYEPSSQAHLSITPTGLMYSSSDSQNIAIHLPYSVNEHILQINRTDYKNAAVENYCVINIENETADQQLIDAFINTYGGSQAQAPCYLGLDALNPIAQSQHAIIAHLTQYNFRPELRLTSSNNQTYFLPERKTYSYSTLMFEPLQTAAVGTKTMSFQALKRWVLPAWTGFTSGQNSLLLEMAQDGTFNAVMDLKDNAYYQQLRVDLPISGSWWLDGKAQKLNLQFSDNRRIVVQSYTSDNRKNSVLAEYYRNNLLVHKAIVIAAPIDNALPSNLMVDLPQVLNNSLAKRLDPQGYQSGFGWFGWEYRSDFTGQATSLVCAVTDHASGYEPCPTGEFKPSYQFKWQYEDGAISSLRNAETFEECSNSQRSCILRSFRLLDVNGDIYTIYEQGVFVQRNFSYPYFGNQPYQVVSYIRPRIRHAKLATLP